MEENSTRKRGEVVDVDVVDAVDFMDVVDVSTQVHYVH
jgi:hypothetical protein